MSDAYGTQKWKHFRSVEVIVGLVELYRTCVSRSLTFCLEKKMSWCQTPLTKEESRRVYNCDDERLSGSTKPWILKSMWNISSSRHRIFKIHLSFTHRSVTVATFPHPETWRWTKRTVIGCLTCRSNGLMGGTWPMKAAMDSRPSAVSLKVWLRETIIFVHIFLV